MIEPSPLPMTPRSVATLVVLAIVASGGAVLAQGFDAQGFHPAPNQTWGHLSVTGARMPAHLEWEAGGTLTWAHDVLVQRDAAGDVVHAPIRSMLTLDVIGSIGLLGDLDIGLDVPVHLASGGESAGDGTTFIEPDGRVGLGDIRLAPRYRFLSTADGNGAGLHLAGQIGVALPTGNRDEFRGGGFQLEPRVIAEYALDTSTAFALNLGYLMRDQAYFGDADLEVDDAITWGVGFRAGVVPGFAFTGDVHGEIGYASITEGTEPHPIEGLLGGEIQVGEVLLNVALGRGLSRGFGTPDLRIVLGATYRQAIDLDRDDDQIPNKVDECPDAAEDYDLFEDDDGCPEGDNDGDGVPDTDDRCDEEAEDVDGFEDGDGCPDPDNDGDGILDVDDTCPDEAEDVDLFADEDGCPELDNDGDGVLDADDECVSDAEDVDGFEDGDGCPDPDNDGDGILDVDDQCDGEAELINGVEDGDGCPEAGVISLDLESSAVELVAEPTWFDGTTSTLTDEAFTALDQLAVALGVYDDLSVRVVVRSADRAELAAREAISTRRAEAIRTALVEDGVPEGRIEISPYAFPIGSEQAVGYEVELRLER